MVSPGRSLGYVLIADVARHRTLIAGIAGRIGFMNLPQVARGDAFVQSEISSWRRAGGQIGRSEWALLSPF